MKSRNKKAFTLIELLVVVSIIGILATIVLASLSSIRGKAKDQLIRVNFNQLRTALEIYNIDHGTYPVSDSPLYSWCTSNPNSSNAVSTCRGNISGPNGWIPGLAPKYIPTLPDHVGTNSTSDWDGWMYRGDDRGYKIMLHDAGETILSKKIKDDDPMRDINLGGVRSYALSACKNVSSSYNFCDD